MLDQFDLKQIKKLFQGELNPLKKDITDMKTDMKTLRSDISKIRKDVNTIVSYFDNEYIDLRKRVERIEEILQLTTVQS